MYTEKQIRKVIREELKRTLVKYSTRKLNEEEESPTEGSEEGIAAKSDFKAWLIDLSKNVSAMKVSAKELDPLKTQIEALIAAAETKDLSGSVGDKLTTQISRLGGLK